MLVKKASGSVSFFNELAQRRETMLVVHES
jgi:hypothetical protein